MAFPFGTVLKAVPSIIDAATKIIQTIKERERDSDAPLSEKVEGIESSMEEQAKVIEDLAVNNKNLVMAIRNSRIIALVALLSGIAACVLAISL